MTCYNVECNGKHYLMKTPLTIGEVKAIWKAIENHNASFLEIKGDPQKRFEFVREERQIWDMVTATLKKCLDLTDEEIGSMSYIEGRSLFNALMTFSARITRMQ